MTQRPSLLQAVELIGRWNIRRIVKDRELRRKLTPKYRDRLQANPELRQLLPGGRQPEDRR